MGDAGGSVDLRIPMNGCRAMTLETIAASNNDLIVGLAAVAV